jgi:hypothetical protein
MNPIRLRQLREREYQDPTKFLKGLRATELHVLAQVADERVRRLRTRELREWRETRVAALFCHGYSQRTGLKILLSKGEFEDADSVASWRIDDTVHFAPIQIKELAPADLNSTASLQQVLDSLSKYTTEDLTILVHVNREIRFTPSQIALPKDLRIASLWFLASITPDQSRWAIWGNYIETREKFEFAYPA